MGATDETHPLTASEDELFAKWPVPDGHRLVRDGCADPATWLALPVRIVFILKEVNHGGSPDLTDLRQALREGPTSRQVGKWDNDKRLNPERLYLDKTWDNVIRWIHGITSGPSEPWARFSEDICVAKRPGLLRGICSVNLNKSGGGAVAKGASIRDAARRDAPHLRDQLALYSGVDFFICCGSNLAAHIIDQSLLPGVDRDESGAPRWRTTRRGVRYLERVGGSTLIDYCHPQARVDDPLVVYPLVDAVQALRARCL